MAFEAKTAITKMQDGFKSYNCCKYILPIYQTILFGLTLYAVIQVSLLTKQVNDLESDLQYQQNQLNQKICDIEIYDGENQKMKFGKLIPNIFELKNEQSTAKNNIITLTNIINTEIYDRKISENKQTKINEDVDSKFKDFNTNLENKLQIIETEQKTTKNDISTLNSNLNTEISDRKNFETKINEDMNNKFNDFNTNFDKKLQNIVTEQQTNTNKISTLTSNLNTEISERQSFETKLTKINEDFNKNQISNNSKFEDINGKLPITNLITITSADWIWKFTASKGQIHTHPSCILKQTFSKKSQGLANIQGHFYYYNQPGCRVYLLKDRNPYHYDWYTFYSNIEGKWVYVDLVVQLIIDPGTYIFEVGMICEQNPKVEFDGVSITMSYTNIS